MNRMRERLSVISTPGLDRMFREQIIQEVMEIFLEQEKEIERQKTRYESLTKLYDETQYQRKIAKVLQHQLNYYEGALRVIAKETESIYHSDLAGKVIKRAQELYKDGE